MVIFSDDDNGKNFKLFSFKIKITTTKKIPNNILPIKDNKTKRFSFHSHTHTHTHRDNFIISS